VWSAAWLGFSSSRIITRDRDVSSERAADSRTCVLQHHSWLHGRHLRHLSLDAWNNGSVVSRRSTETHGTLHISQLAGPQYGELSITAVNPRDSGQRVSANARTYPRLTRSVLKRRNAGQPTRPDTQYCSVQPTLAVPSYGNHEQLSRPHSPDDVHDNSWKPLADSDSSVLPSCGQTLRTSRLVPPASRPKQDGLHELASLSDTSCRFRAGAAR
jgi:hypothetical protein